MMETRSTWSFPTACSIRQAHTASECSKSVSEIYSPLTGTVKSVNPALDANPELLNQDPYIAGWIAEIEISAAPNDLLSSAEYEALTA